MTKEKTKWQKEEVIDAVLGEGRWQSAEGKFTGSMGNILTISRRLNVDRGTIYNYIKRWKSVRVAIRNQKELKKDLVEDKMFKRIMEGSDVMAIFYAKTQMKDRGYVERQELVSFDLGFATDEQLERIAKGEHPATVMANPGGG